MRGTVLHPLPVMLLVSSLVLAITTWTVPEARAWSWMATLVLFWGITGYTVLVTALLRLRVGEVGSNGLQASESNLSEASVKKLLRHEALFHPTTLLAGGAAVTLASYLVLLAPRQGSGVAAIIGLVLAIIVGAASFLWRYAFRYQRRYASRLQEITTTLDEISARDEQAELEQLRERLAKGFLTADFAQGVIALRGLEEKYANLVPLLATDQETTTISMAPLSTLARETYYRGLSVLSDALTLMDETHWPSRKHLKDEIAKFEQEIRGSWDGEDRQESISILENKVTSHRQRLALLDELQLRVDQLVQLAGRCEASLHRTRLEVAAIRAGHSEDSVDLVVNAMQEAVHRTLEVQNELHRLGY